MTLYTYYNQDGKVIYSTIVNGKLFFFFSGFESAKEAKEAILSQYTEIEKIWFEISFEGEWSRIQ